MKKLEFYLDNASKIVYNPIVAGGMVIIWWT